MQCHVAPFRQIEDGRPPAGRDAFLRPAMSAAAIAPEGFGHLPVTPKAFDDVGVVHTATVSRLARRFKRDFRISPIAPAGETVVRMPTYSDDSPEAAELAAKQAERLRRLSAATAKSQAAAARAAGVSKDAWNRMETGTYRVNALALARFGTAFDIPTEYVISGRLAGLPEHLSRVIAALEARDAAPSPPPVHRPADNQAPSASELIDTHAGTRKPGKAKQT